MDMNKMKAYQTIVYHAFLAIKNSGDFTKENYYFAFRTAHAFHNLAEQIALDFKEFNEEEFWNSIDALERDFGKQPYKEIFNHHLKNIT